MPQVVHSPATDEDSTDIAAYIACDKLGKRPGACCQCCYLAVKSQVANTAEEIDMSITTLTSLELNQDVGRAREAALHGPVLITDGGIPAHVLLSFQEYERLTGNRATIADLLAMPGAEVVELEVHPLRDLPKSACFS